MDEGDALGPHHRRQDFRRPLESNVIADAGEKPSAQRQIPHVRLIPYVGCHQTKDAAQQGEGKGAPAASEPIQGEDHQDIARQLRGTGDRKIDENVLRVKDTRRPHITIVHQRHGHPDDNHQNHVRGHVSVPENREHGEFASVHLLLVELQAAPPEQIHDPWRHTPLICPYHILQDLHGLVDLTHGNEPAAIESGNSNSFNDFRPCSRRTHRADSGRMQ